MRDVYKFHVTSHNLRPEKGLLSDPVSNNTLKIVAAGSAFAVILLAASQLSTAEPYIPFAIGGALAFWLRAEPQREEWMWWLAGLVGVGLVLHRPANPDPVLWVAWAAAAVGFASLLMFLMRFAAQPATRRQTLLTGIVPILLVPAYVFSAQKMLIIAQAMHATTLDLYLYAFDGSLGFQPSFLVGRLMAGNIVFREVCAVAYYALPLAMGVAYAASIDVKRGKAAWRLLGMFVAAGLFGWVFYNFFPATGPRYVFVKAFPRLELPYDSLKRLLLEPITINQNFPRNAMPSLHMTWVYLIWWNLRSRSGVARSVVIAFVLLTALGTMGTGEHYFIDLIVAYPFALMVQGVCSALPWRSRTRWIAVGFGCVATLIWNLALRHSDIFLASRVFPWAAVVATLVATEWLRRKMVDDLSNSNAGPSAGVVADATLSEAPTVAPA